LPADQDVEPVALVGDAHVEIVRLAVDYRADLIVMATHGRGFVAHAVMGSTTERVLRTSPCPVLAVRDRAIKTV
jgi:nucleotide-binding universal stress UspA family protein